MKLRNMQIRRSASQTMRRRCSTFGGLHDCYPPWDASMTRFLFGSEFLCHVC